MIKTIANSDEAPTDVLVASLLQMPLWVDQAEDWQTGEQKYALRHLEHRDVAG